MGTYGRRDNFGAASINTFDNCNRGIAHARACTLAIIVISQPHFKCCNSCNYCF